MKKSILYIFVLITIFSHNLMFAPAYSADPASKSMTELLDSSYGIIVISGISTIYAKILYDGAEKQEKESKENIVKIDKIIASFKDSYAAFCPKGREDLTDAKCYCYGADGSKNTNRTNSQICIDLWAKNSYLLSGDATNYNLAGLATDVAGCVNVVGVFDEACKCKKLVNAKGVNACKKETSVSMPNDAFSTALATAGGAADLLKYASKTYNGNPGFDLLNTASIGAKAIKSKQITDALLTKLDKDIKIPQINASNVDRYAKAIIGEKLLAEKMKGASNMATNVSSARSDNPLMENALKLAEVKAGLEMSGGNGLNAKKEKKKGSFDMNFGSDSPGNAGGQVIQDFPEKTYKYKNSDIVTDNSASIFEIISNRYVQSGLKRLFDDEEVK